VKLEKSYAPKKACLVIYVLRSSDYGWRNKSPGLLKARAALHEASTPAKDAFLEVWVHWGSRLYLLWDRGRRV
jgi:hypothetical protein